MPKTIRDSLVKALEQRGAKPVQTVSKKYLAYALPGYATTIYLGKGGSLRVGANITDSIPNDLLKADLWKQLLKASEAK